MAVALTTTAALGFPSAFAAPDTQPGLELRRVLLSSGGVGYFEYEATLQGAADLPLSVRLDQVDDVLKSLVVYDDAGNLGAVTLPGKELARDAFRDLPISQEALSSPSALLSALRGTEVQVEAGGSLIVGRIVSVTEEQKRGPNNEIITQHRLSLLSGGALRQVVVEQIDSLKVLDETLQTQLNAALNALSADRDRDRRELVIHMGGTGERVVRVGYVVEVPLWKSTYRLIMPPSATDKTAALTGFAVIENRSGEDWKDVDLTLVSGNPVTFRQAIYDTYYVDRPKVPVEVLGRVLPIVDPGGVILAPGAETAIHEAADEDSGVRSAPNYAMAPSYDFAGRGGYGRGRGAKLHGESQPGVAPITSALASSEVSQVVLHLTTPVSLTSGQSELLPVISLSLPAERVSLYQPMTDARHPLSSVEITNDGDTDLPPGVIALYERAKDGGATTYAGDAQMPLIPAGKNRFISYAVDLRVTVDAKDKADQFLDLATIVDGTLKLTQRERRTKIYTIAGDAKEPRTVILEHPRLDGFDLVHSADFVEKEATPKAYRLQVEVEAGKTLPVMVNLDRVLVQTIALATISSDQLAVYANTTNLNVKVREALQRIMDLRTLVSDKETTLSQLQAERAKIIEDQARLRENLKVVPAGSDLAKTYLGRLSTQEQRLSILEGEIILAEVSVESAREALAAEIRALRIEQP